MAIFFGVAQSNFPKFLLQTLGSWVGMGALFGMHIESHLTFPLSLEQIAGCLTGVCLKGAVHGAAGHGLVKVHQVANLSGASTQANLVWPPMVRRQPPYRYALDHDGVHGNDLFRPCFWQVLTTNFITSARADGDDGDHYWLPAATSSSSSAAR